MDSVYDVKNLRVTKETISFDLSGESIVVPLAESSSTVLLQTDPKNLELYELDSNGLGIHWPLLDEDLSIEGLLLAAGHRDLIVEHKLPSWYNQEPSMKAS